MICNVCGKKKATVHLTEIIDGKMTELHICEQCAKEKSVHMEQQFGLADLLAGLSDLGKSQKDTQEKVLTCSQCGLTYEDFRKFGRLGCGGCYPAFEPQLSILLKKIHGSNKHLGKKPKRLVQKVMMDVKAPGDLQELKKQLLQAIEKVDFEKAADLRDKIRMLES